jgi:hypothetical protein
MSNTLDIVYDNGVRWSVPMTPQESISGHRVALEMPTHQAGMSKVIKTLCAIVATTAFGIVAIRGLETPNGPANGRSNQEAGEGSLPPFPTKLEHADLVKLGSPMGGSNQRIILICDGNPDSIAGLLGELKDLGLSSGVAFTTELVEGEEKQDLERIATGSKGSQLTGYIQAGEGDDSLSIRGVLSEEERSTMARLSLTSNGLLPGKVDPEELEASQQLGIKRALTAAIDSGVQHPIIAVDRTQATAFAESINAHNSRTSNEEAPVSVAFIIPKAE